MPDGSSHGDGVLRLFNCPLWLNVAIGDGVLWLFNCPIWLNGALKFKSSLCLLQGRVCKRVEWQLCLYACKKKDFEKSRKKVLTNIGTGANIMKLSDRDSEKHKALIERLKKS